MHWALLRFSLGDYVGIFSFWLDIAVLVDYFQAVRMFFVFYFFIEFFPTYQFVWYLFYLQIVKKKKKKKKTEYEHR